MISNVQREPQIEMRLRQPRIKLDRLEIERNRLFGVGRVERHQCVGEIVMRLGVCGIERDRFAVRIDRFAHAAGGQ